MDRGSRKLGSISGRQRPEGANLQKRNAMVETPGTDHFRLCRACAMRHCGILSFAASLGRRYRLNLDVIAERLVDNLATNKPGHQSLTEYFLNLVFVLECGRANEWSRGDFVGTEFLIFGDVGL